jgi:hypothetical protein
LSGAKMNKWEIEQNPDGTCDVRVNRKAFSYDRDDVAEAISTIRSSRKWVKGDYVVFIDSTGSRERISVR